MTAADRAQAAADAWVAAQLSRAPEPTQQQIENLRRILRPARRAS